jgi:CubicO group peptidase (beta-lactamase class C family)
MKRRAIWLTAMFLLVVGTRTTSGSELPTTRPERVGLSAERLERITRTLRNDVEQGRIPGAVVLVARKGQVAYFEAVGFRDKAAGAPMRTDAIFRLASMTKPIVSVPALMLVEEGRLFLSDPVAKYVPAVGKMRVGVETVGGDGKPVMTTVPPSRRMTVQDLMRHTSGITYRSLGTGEIHKMYPESAGWASANLTMDEFMEQLGKAPLLHHPGTTWGYGFSTDVLGRVVEVISGKPLQAFLEERIYRPLQMADTSFRVSPQNRGRIAQPLANDPDTREPFPVPDPTAAAKFDCGGGCAVSTAGDYARFAQMLMNRGVLEGTRILSRKTVEHMTSDHLSANISRGSVYVPGAGYTFGLGVALRQDNGVSSLPGSAGDYFWYGAYGTSFWVDPKEQLVVVCMMQSPLVVHYIKLMRSLVLQSIVD